MGLVPGLKNYCNLQIPLVYISEYVQKRFGQRSGNLVIWLSLIISQPLALMMYYHDFAVVHYGRELLQSFGTP